MEKSKKFPKNDLEKRTANFSKEIILFLKRMKQDLINKPLISQLVRSATSVGANYCEAGGASSKKDFKNKIYISAKKSVKKRNIGWRLSQNPIRNMRISVGNYGKKRMN